ncbi:hypothetical protein B566_EDAN009193 [Ephemera danica]|nr:hypothetical protein B566_EDAN009193 [Ephemera danica]
MNDRKRNEDFSRDNGADFHQHRGGGGGKDLKYDDPPNSRLFIVCGKNITEKDFHDAFQKFGSIEEIWVVKDKTTGESKGVAYIKFSKTSEAAAAMETMNGSCIASHPRPLKVLIAHSREQGSKREMNEEERLLRLFVVVPKSMTDAELRQHFSQFGDLDYVSIVKDHNTKESKGFAYVRYHRVSHAAKAFEGCDRTFRPVFAEPKPPKNDRPSSAAQSNFPGNSMMSHSLDHASAGYPDNAGSMEGYTRLNIIASPSLNQDQLWRLFDLVPDMDYCQILHDPQTRQFKGHAYVVYKNPHAASYAREKLHGFEYPIGQRLIVKPDMELPTGRSNGAGLLNRGSRSLQTGLASLAETLAHATSIIQAAGLSSGPAPAPPSLSASDEAPACSVPLPPRQPWASSDADVAERLFVVCQPEPPPPFALRDVFCRFGNLIDVFMLGGRNCGYAKYASKQSASAAINALHGQTVCGARLKVMTAEPARDPGRKRPRVASDQ